LDIDDLANQKGALAALSRVLLNKSIMVYNRRQNQTQQIQTLRGILLLLVMGACFGIKPALANRLVAGDLVPWVASFFTICATAIILTVFALGQRRRFARHDWCSSRVILLLAVFGPFLPSVLLMWVSGSVSSVTISILLPLEAFIVFVICTGLGIERMTFKRLLGLLLGLAGVLIVLRPSLSFGSDPIFIVVALLIPASFAVRTVVLRSEAVASFDPVTLASSLYIVAVVLSALTLVATGAFQTLRVPDLETSATLAIISAAEALGVMTLIYLVRTAGAVFASQKSFTVALCGVIWSIVLLGADFTYWTGLSLFLLLVGLALVAKRPQPVELFSKKN
jgi:drug/metabolite transporter (DMT)-like permease